MTTTVALTLTLIVATLTRPTAQAWPQTAPPAAAPPGGTAPTTTRHAATPQATPPTAATSQAVLPGTAASQPASAQPAPGDLGAAAALFADARRLFDALDYEQALVRLDALVAQLDPRRADPAVARPLADALELRGRTHYGLGHVDEARADFQSLLTLIPDYAMGDTVSPRVVTLFKQVRAESIGQVLLNIQPPDAAARIDGKPAAAIGQPFDVLAGPHVLGLLRPGYRPDTRDFIVDAGRTVDVTVTMERSSATVAIVTRPAGAEVIVDGVSRGKTAAVTSGSAGSATTPASGAPAPSVPEEPAPSVFDGAPAADSAPLLVAELPTGQHSVEVRRPCFETLRETVTVDQFADYRVGPLALRPAVGAIRVGTNLAADVYLDGQRRGGAPQTIERVCAGSRLLEARTASGRDVRRIEVKAGERVDITLAPRPALALLVNAGTRADLASGADDLRARVARAMEPAAHLFLLALPEDEVRGAEAAERVPAGWLAPGAASPSAVDAAGAADAAGAGASNARARAASSTSTITARRDWSARLSKALGVQGVAAVTRVPGQPGRVRLSLLAAGAGEPDVIELDLDQPAPTLRQVEAASISPASLQQRTLGLSFIDDVQRPGPVVLDSVVSGIVSGDALTAINGQTVTSERDVARVLDAVGTVNGVTVNAQSRAGAEKTVNLPVRTTPRLVTWSSADAPANVLLLDLQARMSETSGLEGTALRLNLAAALTRAGDPTRALAILDELGSPVVGLTAATTAYLRGLALDALGRASEARDAWNAAARAAASLSPLDDPPIAALAAHRLRRAAAPRTP